MNSQSGKGGVAYIMKTEHKLELPRRLQIEYSHVVQKVTDSEGGEVTAAAMWDYFQDEYLPNPAAPWGRFKLRSVKQDSDVDGVTHLRVTIVDNGTEVDLEGTGNGPIAAFCEAMAGTASTSACSTTTSTRCRPVTTPWQPRTSSAPWAAGCCGAWASTPRS